jgi:hypothetical protein
MKIRIVSKSSTVVLAYHFNSQGYYIQRKEKSICFIISLGILCYVRRRKQKNKIFTYVLLDFVFNGIKYVFRMLD